jgi:putative membrane protein
MRLLLRWAAGAAAVGAAAWLIPGIEVQGGVVAFFAVALILGLVNALVRPLLRRLACSLIFLTLGLFLLVINAALLLLTAHLTRTLGVGFEVDGFVPALVGSLVVSLVSFAVMLLFPEKRRPRR